MNKSKQKLELTWIGKDDEYKDIEPRILVEVPEKSYGDKNTENMLIHGDNLLALKALEQDYTGKIKCIYIDPPYNTGSAFEHYDDNVEHSKWLSLMKSRLEILKNLLSNEGCIFVQIDDNEQAYLRILLDEIFGRNNFINTISVNMKNIAGASGGGEDKKLKKNIEYIHVYAKNYEELPLFKNAYDYIPISELVEKYREEGKSWKYTSVLVNSGTKNYIGSTVDGDGNEIKIYSRENAIIKSIGAIIKDENISEEEAYKKYANYIFQTAMPQSSIRPRVMEKVSELGCDNDLYSIEYIPKSGRNRGTLYEQFYKGENFRLFAWLKDVSEEIDGVLYKKELQGTYWDFVGETKNLTKEGAVAFPNGKKPEKLIHRCIDISTKEGDFVLDSFLGSGTTAAVAHKMGRKWIGIELGNHCYTHCIPRLEKIIKNDDKNGITEMTNWKGGGGYKFYELAPSLLKKDEFDNWIIEPKYDAEMLAEAMAKHEGYKFSPDENNVYKQGYSTEKDFIFTTTQFLSNELLNQIHNKLEEGESLLICATHFEEGVGSAYSNITVKKIPQMLLNRCEFGRAEYNLNIIEEAQPEDIEEDFEEEG
ncbi:MAG: site-specific DNA-methyltransferase [Bacteroidales bacterium]|nr:site-specific DNA-methyltransferase [Bacteroidales bacterium]